MFPSLHWIGTDPDEEVLSRDDAIFTYILPRDIPAWLGHEATDIPSEGENEDKTVEVEETSSWTEIILENDSTVAIIVPFQASVCCKEVFITHSALDKHVISS
jgi:hypothetical protein